MIAKEKGRKRVSEEEEIGKLFIGIMEGYKDSLIPPLSEFNPAIERTNCEKGSSSSKKRDRTEASEIKSVQNERNRRGKMAESYSVLLSLVPSLFPIPKPSRERTLTETINYIRSLEQEKERLEGLKSSLLQKPVLSGCTTYLMNPSVTASLCNGVAFFGIQLPAKRGLLRKIAKAFEKYHAEVLEVTIFVNDHGMLTLTGTFMVGNDGAFVVEKIKKEILIL
ncbi:uncharacterized protein [Coffea arabica]|uniref:BHLH domain-containing protein n=1 Tax=Coffea arabica TaxID=13443 RepID=A0A6P6X1D3_COFAR|nr:uncharacterized protein LOC113736740 [Coffea arabica]